MIRQFEKVLSLIPTLCLALISCVAADEAARDTMRLVEHRRIWDSAPHNAFTDLIRFKGNWYCAFREAKGHVSPSGKIRILRSQDGAVWKSVALLVRDGSDLRDAKLSIAPDGRLMLLAAASWHEKTAPVRRQSMVWFSRDGESWTDGQDVGEKDFWLWRVTWRESLGLGVGYHVRGDDRFARLYQTHEGNNYRVLVPRLLDEGRPGEATIRFLSDGTALCLVRRDGSPNSALLGRATAPYKDWEWMDLGIRVGGPNFIRIPSGQLLAVCRLYDGKTRTSVCRLSAEEGMLGETLTLPSGGDTSYAGLVWHDKQLWISYYSSHEGKSSIYLAQVAIEPTAP